jgi:hypothetical protein
LFAVTSGWAVPFFNPPPTSKLHPPQSERKHRPSTSLASLYYYNRRSCQVAADSISPTHNVSIHIRFTMGCCGGEREKYGALNAEQKWDYIVRAYIQQLNDLH